MGTSFARTRTAFLSLVCISCAAEPDLKPANTTTGTNANNAGKPDVFLLTRPAEDASKLTISDLYVTQMRIKGVIVPSLYVTTSGAADNVEIVTCYDAPIRDASGNQVQHTGCDATRKETVTRLIFQPFPNSAEILFKARSCVLPERAATPGVLCGPWKEITWSQPPNGNAVMSDLLARRERIRAEIAEFSQTLKETFSEFEKESAACIARQKAGENVPRVRNIVANFMQLGDLLISKAMEPGNMNAQGASNPPSANTETPIPAVPTNETVNAVQRNAEAINTETQPELQPGIELLSQIPREGSQMALTEGAAPVGALQILGNAVVDIATATVTAEANRACYAQQNSEGKLKAANGRLAEMRAKLADVENQIKAAGGVQ